MPTSLIRRLAAVALAVVHGLVVVDWAHAWDASQAATQRATDHAQPPIMPFAPPPVAFEGFALADFQGAESVAAALDDCAAEPHPPEGILEFKGIDVRGPNGQDAVPAPMAAEVRSRIDGIDVSAGVAANPERLDAGPSQWTGRIGVSSDRDSGSESFELRTMLAPCEMANIVGVAAGPRFERRFRRGLTIFIDGQAEAQAMRSTDASWLPVPGGADGSLATLGVTARTGFVR